MSLRFLLDEDAQASLLAKLLRQAGHDVVTVNEAGLVRQADSIVLEYARGEMHLLITYNCDDFEALHDANPFHPGILVVYRDANASKNMSFRMMVSALANLEAANIPLENQFIALNPWKY